MKLPKILTDMMTQGDNTTFCPVRGGGLGSLVVLFGFQGWSVYQKAEFHPDIFAVACSTTLVSIGGGVALKRKADAPPDGS